MVASMGHEQAFRRTVRRTIGLPIALLAVLVLIFLWQVSSLVAAARWVEHTDQVIAQANRLQTVLIDQETGLRGYLLTGEQEFLEPYQRGTEGIQAVFDVLTTLTADNPQQQQRLIELRANEQRWLVFSREALALRESGGDYIPFIEQRVGKGVMDIMRGQLATFITTEETLRDQRAQTARRTAAIVIDGSILAGLVLGVSLIVFLRRQITGLARNYEAALTTALERSEALRVEREWFSGTLSSIGDAVIATDSQGRVTFLNSVAQALIGWGQDVVRGKPLDDVFVIRNETTHTPVESPVEKVLRDGQVVGLANHTELVRPDGTSVAIDDSAAPIRDERGTLLGVVLVFRDISERKQAEHTLAERTAILRAVTEGAADAIYVKDRQGRMVLVNPATLRVIGKPEAEIIGKTEVEYLANSVEATQLAENDRRVMESRQVQMFEEVVELPDGIRTFLSTKSPYFDEHGNVIGLIGISTEITERKRMEDELRESESQLRLALDAAQMGTWTWNIGADLAATDAYSSELLGVAPTNIDAALAIIHADDREQVREAINQTIAANAPFRLAFRVVQPDETLRWMEASGRLVRDDHDQPMRLVGVIQDITERRQANDQIRASERRYRDLADSMPLIVWTARPDGWLDYYNRRWFEYTGMTLEETQGWGWGPVLHPDDVQPCVDRWSHSVRTGEPYEIEYRWKRASDKMYRWHLGRALPIHGEHGQIVSWTGTGTDIDDQKRLAEQLREQTEELARATHQLEERNRELDQFAYITSHDLKAPLRGIANLSQWIEEDLGDQATKDIQKQMNLLRGRVHRMEGLIDGILQYSRIGRVKIEPERVDVGMLLRDIVDLLAPSPGVRIDIAPHMPTLLAERVPLTQVFQNLISNALKHHHRPDQAYIQVYSTDAGSCYEFSVRDDGPGIAPQYHERIFVIFQTLASRDKLEGSGLGLSLVKKIIESQGGSISVQSNEGQGAVFTFTWPKQPKKGR